jgi:hypothetical protein
MSRRVDAMNSGRQPEKRAELWPPTSRTEPLSLAAGLDRRTASNAGSLVEVQLVTEGQDLDLHGKAGPEEISKDTCMLRFEV